ncbi:hypothetical protein T10_11769 [Trichinella papuae]|uniref:Uncharacterized protein n=1 Tax=Trichinella papuae TaxID=268474 RepID=A0A0V1LZZ5_9BILA|nr:hypothetical protein T10_11769 [Trichinella papuae]
MSGDKSFASFAIVIIILENKFSEGKGQQNQKSISMLTD